jgi:hypothetical protein
MEFGFPEVVKKVHPGTKAYVSLGLPGYTKDRTKCVLWLSWGWTPHGASALYLLEKRRGQWVVVNRALIYRG